MQRQLSRISALTLLALATACASGGGGSDVSSPADVRYAYVLLGPDGVAVARAVTVAATCPAIAFDGAAPVQMAVHAAAATIPTRPTAYDSLYSPGPAAFPVTTCDANVPAGTVHAAIGDRALPMPRRHVRRIVLIGDTGCRMKEKTDLANGQYQACDDPTQWPFQAVANLAASFEPDLVVHAGDFHYRETPCPAGTPCANVQSYGFGWASWEPDFFAPAERLFAAAPWVMVRGDHETCDRGGQGWWRFLDPRPPRLGQNCNAAADDLTGSYSDPYVVPLDDDLAAVVLDSGSIGSTYDPANFESWLYTVQVQEGLARAAPYAHNLFLNHQPILAYNSGGSGNKGEAAPGNAVLQGVLHRIYDDPLFPGAVDAVLSGHVHLAQVAGYSTGQPPTFVAGNSGTQLIDLFTKWPTPPTPYPPGTLTTNPTFQSFGLMVMDRTQTGWTVTARAVDGSVLTTCTTLGRTVTCTP